MSRTGEPILRPLFWHYAEDRAFRINDQFLFGRDVLVAPVVERGARERMIWLSPGLWCDYHTGTAYQGENDLVISVPLDRIPVFVRAGSVLSVAAPAACTEKMDRQTLTFEVRPGGETRGTLYEDDGRSLTPALEHRYQLQEDGTLAIDFAPGSDYKVIVLEWVDPHTGERTQCVFGPGPVRQSYEEARSR